MLSMTISWTSSSLSVLGPRSRSQRLFLEKNIVIALVPSFIIRGYGYVLLRFGGNVVRRMGTQQQRLIKVYSCKVGTVRDHK